MKYLVFDTEDEANAAEAQISSSMNYPAYGKNALSHQTVTGVGVTEKWAIPRQTATGLWVFQSPDSNGVEWDSAWNFPESEE